MNTSSDYITGGYMEAEEQMAQSFSNSTRRRILTDTINEEGQARARYTASISKNATRAGGIILPSFASPLSMDPNDTQYQMSTAPYRDASRELVKMAGSDMLHQPFSGWYRPIQVHLFWGREGHDILSPRINPTMPGNDPINDIRRHLVGIEKNDKNHPWLAYLAREGAWGKYGVANAYSNNAAVMNAYCPRKDDPTKFENMVLVMKSMAFNAMLGYLNETCPNGVQPVDPNYPLYAYGDVTGPTHAMQLRSREIASATSPNIKCHTLYFGHAVQNPSTGQISHIDCNKIEVTPEMLRNRTRILQHSTFNYATTKDVIDLIVDDATLPCELVKQVCGAYADVPTYEQAASKTISTAPAPQPQAQAYSQDVVAGFGGFDMPPSHNTAPAMPAPPMPTPPAPTPLPPTPPAPAVMYWIHSNGNTVQGDEAMVRDMHSRDAGVMVQKIGGDGTWMKAEGTLIQVAPPAPPMPTPPAPAEVVPTPPAPAPVASPAPAPAPAVAQIPDAMHPMDDEPPLFNTTVIGDGDDIPMEHPGDTARAQAPVEEVVSDTRTKEEEDKFKELNTMMQTAVAEFSANPENMRELARLNRLKPFAG